MEDVEQSHCMPNTENNTSMRKKNPMLQKMCNIN